LVTTIRSSFTELIFFMIDRIASISRMIVVLLLAATTTFAQQSSGSTPGPAVLPPTTAKAQVLAPQQVLSVVHKMSSEDIRKLLERQGYQIPPNFPMDEREYHTRIAAGYAIGNNGSIMTWLPRQEIESLYQAYAVAADAAQAPTTAQGTGSNEPTPAPRAMVTPAAVLPNLFVLRSNGQTYSATLVGWDGSTGFALLQANGLPVIPDHDADLAQVRVDDQVRVVAPEAAPKPKGGANRTTKLLLALGEVRGQISDIQRDPRGEVKSMTLSLDDVDQSHARRMIGGVVLNGQGETIGMVEYSTAAKVRVVPLPAMRRAAERVRSRLTKPGQPWLGVVGEPVVSTTVEECVATGWKKSAAQQVVEGRRGVLLTRVPAGTPAYKAGLRAGDVILRVDGEEIVDAEDLASVINHGDVETPLTFSVLRPNQTHPESVTVRLGTSPNPSRETLELLQRTEKRPASVTVPRAAVSGGVVQPLYAFGVSKMDLSGQLAEKFSTEGGWLVTSVLTGSLAAKAGLLAGDVIESVNGQPAGANFAAVMPTTECRLEIIRKGQKMVVVLGPKN
jgi:S1-C subfamily serine protease